MNARLGGSDLPEVLKVSSDEGAGGSPRGRNRFAWVIWTGAAILAAVGLGFPVETTITAPGRVIPSDRVMTVQHLEGGIVSAVRVREGERVKQGQPLMEIDLGGVGMNLEEIAARHASNLAARVRLIAESQGRPLTRSDFPDTLDSDVVKGELGAYEARMQEQRGLEASANSVAAQARSRALEQQAKVTGLGDRLTIAQKEVEISSRLFDEKLVGQLELLQKQREFEATRMDLQVNRQMLVSAQSAVAEADGKVVETRGRFRRRASDELATVERQLASVSEELSRARTQRQRTVVRAQSDGLVKGLRSPNPGWVVKPGEPIMEIVPDEEQILIEAKLSPNDRGFVHVGQAAKIKVTAFDFLRYGAVDGQVTLVAADADRDATVPDAPPYYRVMLNTSRPYVGQPQNRITAGMQAEADLVVGHDPFIWYLLRPVLRMQREAFREP